MADTPQEVREAASRIADRICGCADRKQHLADIELLLAYREEAFLAGKRAGMERAAEIVEADNKLCDCHAHSESECACGAWWDSMQVSPLSIAQAIRSENDG